MLFQLHTYYTYEMERLGGRSRTHKLKTVPSAGDRVWDTRTGTPGGMGLVSASLNFARQWDKDRTGLLPEKKRDVNRQRWELGWLSSAPGWLDTMSARGHVTAFYYADVYCVTFVRARNEDGDSVLKENVSDKDASPAHTTAASPEPGVCLWTWPPTARPPRPSGPSGVSHPPTFSSSIDWWPSSDGTVWEKSKKCQRVLPTWTFDGRRRLCRRDYVRPLSTVSPLSRIYVWYKKILYRIEIRSKYFIARYVCVGNFESRSESV